jgi:hypothetical protein
MTRLASLTRATLLLPLATFGACGTIYEGVDLFPLYRDVGDEKAGEFWLLLPPVYSEWNENESLSWSLPFHLHRRTGAHSELTHYPLLPIWYHSKTPASELKALFPLWQRDRIGVRDTTKIALLLANWTTYSDEPGLKALGIAPLFQWRAGVAGDAHEFVTTGDFLTGKYGAGALASFVSIDRTRPSFGTVDGPGIEFDLVNLGGGLVQLFHYDNTGTHDETRLLTLFGSEPLALYRHRAPHEGTAGDRDSVTMLFPLWFDFVMNSTERFFSLWPFYGYSQRESAVTDRYFAWPVLTTRHDTNVNGSGFELLAGWLGSVETSELDETWCWPLFSVKTSDRGHDWRVLFGFLGHAANESRRVTYLFWIPIESDDDAEASESATESATQGEAAENAP